MWGTSIGPTPWQFKAGVNWRGQNKREREIKALPSWIHLCLTTSVWCLGRGRRLWHLSCSHLCWGFAHCWLVYGRVVEFQEAHTCRSHPGSCCELVSSGVPHSHDASQYEYLNSFSGFVLLLLFRGSLHPLLPKGVWRQLTSTCQFTKSSYFNSWPFLQQSAGCHIHLPAGG